jgi:murein DD-endopeptidase MepM/ murein hydrolase activator NlpD
LARLSSRFSNARLHPILNTVRAHRGVDFAAATGTEIMATGDGVVITASRRGDLGNLVEIRHPNGWVTRYGHLSRYGPGIRVGTRVRQSQIVGYVGMTGLASGPHLHYEMRLRNGTAMDPLGVQLPPGDPVPSEARARWALESRERLALLERLPGPPILRMAEGPQADSLPGPPARGGQ